MTDLHPVAERYLEQLSAQLRHLPADDRREVVEEITNHIADAIAAGTPLDRVLSSLGSAEELARAYEVELLINRPHRSHSRLDTALRLVGLVALGGIPTFAIVVTLGTVGVTFVTTGAALFLFGVMAPFGAPYWMQVDMDPRWAVFLSPALIAGGVLSLLLLRAYVRVAVRTVRQVLHRITNRETPHPI